MKLRFFVLAAVMAAAVAAADTAAAHAPKHGKAVLTNLEARETFQRSVIRHDQHVIRFFRSHRWLLVDHAARSTAARELRFHRAQLRWTKKELHETIAAQKARERARVLASTDWRAYLYHLVGADVTAGCALPLIGRESGGGVTTWNRGGSGAYGLGQALPASKMSAFGSDYMTNGVTQIKWMHAYVNRYGGWCGANAFQARNGWY